jgi:hypothetical protein
LNVPRRSSMPNPSRVRLSVADTWTLLRWRPSPTPPTPTLVLVAPDDAWVEVGMLTL